jgi:hypothetical protein
MSTDITEKQAASIFRLEENIYMTTRSHIWEDISFYRLPFIYLSELLKPDAVFLLYEKICGVEINYNKSEMSSIETWAQQA